MSQRKYDGILRKELTDDEFNSVDSDLVFEDEDYRLHEYNPHPVQSLAYKVFDIVTLGIRSEGNYILEDTKENAYFIVSKGTAVENYMEEDIAGLLEPERN